MLLEHVFHEGSQPCRLNIQALAHIESSQDVKCRLLEVIRLKAERVKVPAAQRTISLKLLQSGKPQKGPIVLDCFFAAGGWGNAKGAGQEYLGSALGALEKFLVVVLLLLHHAAHRGDACLQAIQAQLLQLLKVDADHDQGQTHLEQLYQDISLQAGHVCAV